MMKVVLKVEAHDERTKQKAMKLVSGLQGVDSVEMNMKDRILTVTGNIDPVKVVGKLRKLCCTDLVTAGPKKEEPKKDDVVKLIQPCPWPYYYPYNPPQANYYCRQIEDPNGCVIC